MRILMITPYLPYPLVSGGQIRTYNLLKNLSAKHRVTLVSFIRNNTEKKNLENLKQFCRGVYPVLRRPAWSAKNIILAAFTFFPFLIAIYYSARARKIIAKLLSETDFDLIHAETFYVMPNIPKTKIPILLVEQTIEYLVYSHFVKSVPIPLRPILSWDVAKIKFWERHYWDKAAKVVAMSEDDCGKMKKLVQNLNCEIVPNGVDSEFFAKTTTSKSENPTVLFVGNFKWLQNREAAEFLIEKIWSKVLTKVSNAKLLIVGKNPSERLLTLAAKYQYVEINTTIDDIRQAYQKANVLAAPIFGPGGTRYKILEAAASGIPVVTTPAGIQGIPAVDKVHLLIRQQPDEFSEAIVKLLKEKNFAQKISENGKNLIISNFDWRKISQKLDKIYREVAHV